jgi:septal ring factor EnvC (AmiA/AmiB activator)
MTDRMRIICQNIEDNGPSLRKQREDYERSMQSVTILSSQLDSLSEENTRLKTEVVQFKRNAALSEREIDRLRGQIKDLSRQICATLADRQREQLDSLNPDYQGGQTSSPGQVGFLNDFFKDCNNFRNLKQNPINISKSEFFFKNCSNFSNFFKNWIIFSKS